VQAIADAARRQGRHYDGLVDLYEIHATDDLTARYRRRFIDAPLLEGVDLHDSAVLEAMCGSGHSTGYLLERGARVTGLDVSEQAITLFRGKWPQCKAVVSDILEHELPSESFDVVVIVGGLHHVHPNVDAAVAEIWRLLKPNGLFCFSEPHTGSVVNLMRRWWYRRDRLFEDNEAAIDVTHLRRRFEGKFAVLSERYFGNVAHTLVLNSLVLRAPTWLKRVYGAPAIAIEAALNPVLGRRLSCSVSCRWRKIA
jgi:SAM-dependent methyltransferase